MPPTERGTLTLPRCQMAEGDATAFPEEEQRTVEETPPCSQPCLPPPCHPAPPQSSVSWIPEAGRLEYEGSRGGSVLWGQVRVNVGPRVEGFPQRREGRWPGLRSLDVQRSQEPTSPLPLPPWALFLVAGFGMVSLLLCGVSIALPLFIRAGTFGLSSGLRAALTLAPPRHSAPRGIAWDPSLPDYTFPRTGPGRIPLNGSFTSKSLMLSPKCHL